MSLRWTKTRRTAMSKLTYIRPAAVRALIRQAAGKRVSKDFLEALDRFVEAKVRQAAGEHNGGKKTVDGSVAAYTLGAPRR
jgi:histone H3/H4